MTRRRVTPDGVLMGIVIGVTVWGSVALVFLYCIVAN